MNVENLQRGAQGLRAPFLRWAGSKRWIVPRLLDLVPRAYGSYHEPFLGSGAVFFGLSPVGEAHLSDALAPLIRCWRAVQHSPTQVAMRAAGWQTDQETFYNVRSTIFESDVDAAAQFIYLNKLCFNGLYRENRNGQFNVPYGRPKSTRILFDEHLENAASLLQSANILNEDFDSALDRCLPGDLVYLDPPYVKLKPSEAFVDYNAKAFLWEDQKRLAKRFKELSDNGVHIMLSNVDDESVRDLYGSCQMVELSRYSSMSGKPKLRGGSSELLVLSESLSAREAA